MTRDSAFNTPAAPGTATVIFSGELDIASKAALREQLDFFSDVPDICLDFSGVDYMDSTIIGELIRLHKQRIERGFVNEVLVVGQNQPIRRLFKILHLEALFQIRDDRPDRFTANPGEDAVRVCLRVVDGTLAVTHDPGGV